MHLFKKITLAILGATLLSTASFAQKKGIQSVDAPKVDIMSSWMNHDAQSLSSAFNGYSPTWGSYLLGLEKGAYPYAELFNAFKADFISQYRTTPNRDSINYLQQYYEQRKNDPAGHLLLPTIAIWCNYPLTSIIPLENHLNAYWGNPDLAGDAYDLMAQIDPEETFYSVAAHMGALKGHPTNQTVLESFWTSWTNRMETSAARADVTYLKQSVLEEILKYADTYGAAYTVQELASSGSNLWPAIHVSPITPANQARVQHIISSYCTESNFSTSCKTFIDYAYAYGYITAMPQGINNYVVVSDPVLSVVVDPWYYIGYHRVIYTYPLWTYWHHRPHITHPRHRPHGHHPHVTPPGHAGHRAGHPGGGGHGHPGENKGDNPGHHPGGHGHHSGGNDNPGHHPGGGGSSQGGNNGHPGNHDGHGNNGHNPGGQGGHGHQPDGHHGDNGNPGSGNNGGHNPGGNDNPGGNPPAGGDNGSRGGHRGGHGLVDRTHTAITREHISPQAHTRVATRHEATRMSAAPTNGSSRHSGFSGDRNGHSATSMPHHPSNEAAHRSFGRSSFSEGNHSAGGFHQGGFSGSHGSHGGRHGGRHH